MFPITPILLSSKVQDGVSSGVLDIMDTGIANVASGKGGKVEVKYVSFLP